VISDAASVFVSESLNYSPNNSYKQTEFSKETPLCVALGETVGSAFVMMWNCCPWQSKQTKYLPKINVSYTSTYILNSLKL